MTDQPSPTPTEQPAPTEPPRPAYKGAPLDPGRGPGLGCFWAQVVVLAAFLLLTPLGVINAWPVWLTTAMLVITLVLTLFTGQTVIFLLRLVAADRRSRRRPLRAGTTRTVGQIDEEAAADEKGGADGAGAPPSVRQ